MEAVIVPLRHAVHENRKRDLGIMALAALLTLFVLSILAAISPKVMLVAASCTFAVLFVRFVWLVSANWSEDWRLAPGSIVKLRMRESFSRLALEFAILGSSARSPWSRATNGRSSGPAT